MMFLAESSEEKTMACNPSVTGMFVWSLFFGPAAPAAIQYPDGQHYKCRHAVIQRSRGQPNPLLKRKKSRVSVIKSKS